MAQVVEQVEVTVPGAGVVRTCHAVADDRYPATSGWNSGTAEIVYPCPTVTAVERALKEEQ